MTQPRVAVIGGGFSGLSAAFDLLRAGRFAVTIFEATDRFGGLIETVRRPGGWLIERGADSFIRTKPAGVTLCADLGIADQLISPLPDHQRALIARDGEVYPVPDDFHLLVPRRLTSLLETPVLSTQAKLRALCEAAIPPAGEEAEESLASFTRRRWGSEMLHRLVQPLVAGIYSADPESLSLAATMPQFLALEREHGSLTAVGVVQRDREAKASGARYDLFASFPNGMQTLVDVLVDAVSPADQRRSTVVRSVSRVGDQWSVVTASGCEAFDAVLFALPARLVGELLGHAVPGLAAFEGASSVIVVSGHRLADFEHSLDAFGLVIPHAEQSDATAISFSSRKFPGRAPDGHIVIRTFLSCPPGSLAEGGFSDEEWIDRAGRVLSRYLGLSSDPLFAVVTRYDQSSPQYTIGHQTRVDALFASVRSTPGLFLAGASYRGVGLPDAIASGREAAANVVQAFA